jgi:dCMP deaminase
MIKELHQFNPDEIIKRKGTLGLLVLDEKSITCQRLPELKATIEGLGDEVILMMLSEQYKKGLRGWAKAQILNAFSGLAGVMPVTVEELHTELQAGWKAVAMPDSIVLESNQIIQTAEKKAAAKFPVTDSDIDRKWIKYVKEIVGTSNCWYDPVGCVFVRDGQMLVEGVSTSLNNSLCKNLPLDFRQLPLNPGERLFFCDSLHAERVGVSKAAKQGLSLAGSTLYLSKFPCRLCIQSVLEAGISEVVFEKDSYGIPDAQLLLDNGVIIKRMDEEKS